MGTLADCSGLPEGQSGTPVKWLVQPAMMMALLPRALEGAGAVATTRPPARRTGLGIAHSVRAPVAHAEGQASARAGEAPRRDVDGGSLRGDGGACCDHPSARARAPAVHEQGRQPRRRDLLRSSLRRLCALACPDTAAHSRGPPSACLCLRVAQKLKTAKKSEKKQPKKKPPVNSNALGM